MKQKIVVLTNGNYFARLILEKTFAQYSDSIAGVLIVTGDYKGRSGLASIMELLKVTAWPYFFYKAFQIALFILAGKVYAKACFGVEQLARIYQIPTCSCKSVKEEKAIEWIAACSPDLIVSVSCPQFIGKAIRSLARVGSINIHSSLLPAFAGLAPYFWVLSTGQTTTGTTVHYMTQRFDEGNILVQKQLTIEPGESAFHLFTRLAYLGNDALAEAIPLALQGLPGRKQDLEKYGYFSSPT
ncbi:MAG TPA: formyltransferase family protein, partial [Anaerolineaceae bacterium]|nr:formyltransferase family protein [Anaerolineaceae bacterium]